VLKIPNFVLKVSYNRFTCFQGKKKKVWNGSIKNSVSLNPFFPKAYSALIGQMAQSVLISRPPSACVGNEMAITISEFQLWIFLSTCIDSDTNSNDGFSFTVSFGTWVLILWKCMQSGKQRLLDMSTTQMNFFQASATTTVFEGGSK